MSTHLIGLAHERFFLNTPPLLYLRGPNEVKKMSLIYSPPLVAVI